MKTELELLKEQLFLWIQAAIKDDESIMYSKS